MRKLIKKFVFSKLMWQNLCFLAVRIKALLFSSPWLVSQSKVIGNSAETIQVLRYCPDSWTVNHILFMGFAFSASRLMYGTRQARKLPLIVIFFIVFSYY